MPPKTKVTREDILLAALDIVRSSGAHTINARTVAASLNCSTQPVFSNFATMEDLQTAVRAAAYQHYLSFLQQDVEHSDYPAYKAMGMAYIRFAQEEKELFKLLFLCDYHGEGLPSSVDWETAIEMIMQANKVTREIAELMHLEMWVCVHGIATMLATSYWNMGQDLISRMTSDIYHGIRTRHCSKEVLP